MGCNYYLIKNVCDHCGRGDEQLHIGKSSMGWCFGLHVLPEQGINGLDDWKVHFAQGKIESEYGDQLTVDEMLEVITKRASNPWSENNWNFYGSEEALHAANHSERGPNNLLRHSLMPGHCIGHGEGTWDHIIGEFG